MHIKYLIIGAGPTGLGAAHRLKELGESDFLILEKQPHVGGLAASFVDENGFTWDIGGHVLFSHYPYFDHALDAALGPDGWHQHGRESWIRIHDRFVPYPFQYNLHRLPPSSLRNSLQGLIHRPLSAEQKPANFKEWLLASFGRGIASEFLFPYNLKVWGYPLEMLGYQWIGERVAVVDNRRVLSNVLYDKDDISWGPNSTFRFPRYGGTGSIWQAIAQNIGLSYIAKNTDVVAVNSKKHSVTTSDGNTYTYDHLLSSMPLTVLTQIDHSAPTALKTSCAKLLHSSVYAVGTGFRVDTPAHLKTKCWMYFPESNCPFYRVTVFSNYSPNNVPSSLTQFSLQSEISESPVKPVNSSTIIEDTLAGLKAAGILLRSEELITSWAYRADYAYPTPTSERDGIIEPALKYYDKFHIYPRGRFGTWKYEIGNMDHCFMQGVELANRLVKGEPEHVLGNR